MKAQRQERVGMCGECREVQDGQRRRDLQTREGLEDRAERWGLTQSLEASILAGKSMACGSPSWGLVKKGGGGREARLEAAALEKQVRAGLKSTVPGGSPPGSKSNSSTYVLCGLR